MTWEFYGLDERARKLVKQQLADAIEANLPAKETQILIKESHKMRQTVAYGLERFWGEQLRLEDKESAKANYWRNTWNELVAILKEGEVNLPQHQDVDAMADALWRISPENQQIALSILTQLCDSLVWWTQRYKSLVTNNNK
ncbi:MAG: hypothetical protein F6K23_39660 [Okeania sp. SIO2C9]|uniref:hypothetical protein n=1 Tax=Okeania sp. SIO2C9 TaxID=2607791 RepID=UPI0013C25F68|nr:hypothetical protein [Okeania sp. SIO2C9]NEQ78577.1 hypothetical protein [Okeania sp. SIO2C9]